MYCCNTSFINGRKKKKSNKRIIKNNKKKMVKYLSLYGLSNRKTILKENSINKLIILIGKIKKGNILQKRYYYMFRENELESLIPDDCIIKNKFYEKGNWGIIIKKPLE